MILSKKFVSDYIDISDLDIKQIAEDMTSVGNEYDYAGTLLEATNLVVGEVIESVKHPDSDKLRVNKVNIGSEILDIVCGAPNCRLGLKVIVAKVGAVLPQVTIKSSIIRGEKSNGMLCSLNELGIDNKFLKKEDSEGIHELPLNAKPGTNPLEYINFNDEIIDFELTSNRGDLLSIMGMAYELGAIYKKEVNDIDLSYTEIDSDINDCLALRVDTKDCSLFLAKKVSNLVIEESPDFIKSRLISSGIRPINNVVDISNFVMLETGQPLHFYDADKLGNSIIVRDALLNEMLKTLDGNIRTLSETDIVIANNNEAIGLAGVMGGYSTEVDSNTRNIIIESAIFDKVKVRKTSKKVLRSEASSRFEKGLDSNRTFIAINRACYLLEKYAGASINKGIITCGNDTNSPEVIKVDFNKVYKVLGIKIPNEEIISILKSLGFDVEYNDIDFTVTVPSRRLDIHIPEDIIEEVGRMYGMDNIKSKLPSLNTKFGKSNNSKREIRNKMISFGFNETINYSLISEKDVFKFCDSKFEYVKIQDPMTIDRNTLRGSLVTSLVEVYNYNKSRNCKNVSIFEIGKCFYKEDIYKEDLKLAGLISGNYYLGLKPIKSDFYILKGIVEEVLDYLGYKGRYSFNAETKINELHPGQSAIVNVQGKNIGFIGKLHPKESKDDIYVFEINIDKLLLNKVSKMTFKELSKYPSINKDLAFIVDKDIISEQLVKIMKKSGGKLLTNIEPFDVYVGDNLEEGKKSIAYSLTFSDSSKTLTDEEVMVIFNKIIEETEKQTNAKLRDK